MGWTQRRRREKLAKDGDDTTKAKNRQHKRSYLPETSIVRDSAPKFDKELFKKGYQKRVGIGARALLHKNSIELVRILKENNILKSGSKVFELGSGPARNLHYILEEYKDLDLYCSDLYSEASHKHMSESIKNVITFFEGDSQDIIDNNVLGSLNLFLVSDHFMHLQYEKADYIIKKILSNWKPEFIMLREVKEEYETPKHPRLFHNYDQFLSDYNLIVDVTSKQSKGYFIWLLERKKIDIKIDEIDSDEV